MRYLLAAILVCSLVVGFGPDFARGDEPGTTPFAHIGPIVVHGNEADNLLLGAGAFDIRHDSSGAGTIEYRFGRKVFVVGLTLGLMANTEGGLFGYVGAYGDLSYKQLYVTPQLAMGGYHEGSSQDLGGVFQFRESLDVAWRFDNGHRLGIRAAHISNASIHEINPGEEELFLIYSVPPGPVSVSAQPQRTERIGDDGVSKVRRGDGIDPLGPQDPTQDSHADCAARVLGGGCRSWRQLETPAHGDCARRANA